MTAYRELCRKISGVLPQYFDTIPSAPLEIVAKDSETAPAAYYMQGTNQPILLEPPFPHSMTLIGGVPSPNMPSRLFSFFLGCADLRNSDDVMHAQGTSDGTRPGRFYVNVSNLHQRPKYEMCALALHEGIPGHHHQGSLAIENAAIPSFLRFIEDRRYEFCPAR